MVGLQGLRREETKPPSHHSSPIFHGNESEALDTASVNLINAFQLVNTRQDHLSPRQLLNDPFVGRATGGCANDAQRFLSFCFIQLHSLTNGLGFDTGPCEKLNMELVRWCERLVSWAVKPYTGWGELELSHGFRKPCYLQSTMVSFFDLL